MMRFRRGWANILYQDPRAREKLGAAVRARLAQRVAEGYAVGAPRVGEICEGEPRHGKGNRAAPSTRRYVGLDAEGKLALRMRREGATLEDISKTTGWPVSTVWEFLQRRKAEDRLS